MNVEEALCSKRRWGDAHVETRHLSCKNRDSLLNTRSWQCFPPVIQSVAKITSNFPQNPVCRPGPNSQRTGTDSLTFMKQLTRCVFPATSKQTLPRTQGCAPVHPKFPLLCAKSTDSGERALMSTMGASEHRPCQAPFRALPRPSAPFRALPGPSSHLTCAHSGLHKNPADRFSPILILQMRKESEADRGGPSQGHSRTHAPDPTLLSCCVTECD